jgi:hypothetical protein
MSVGPPLFVYAALARGGVDAIISRGLTRIRANQIGNNGA